MIPPYLHFVWCGPAEMPDEYCRNIVGWMRLHPRWWVRVWSEGELVDWLWNVREFKDAHNAAEAADIARYELVLRRGGIYLDCDVKPVRSLGPLLDLEAFAGSQGNGEICTAALGAEPGHPAFAELVAALPHAFRYGDNNLTRTGPLFLTDVLGRHPEVTILPQEAFYPYLFREEPRPPTPGTYGVHTWAASWVK